MTLSKGDKLGKYTILKEWRRGGYGVIYKAIDNSLNEIVAIKTLRQDVSPQQYKKNLERLEREKDILNRMSGHPNIVKYYEYFQEEKALVMEFLDGNNLSELLEQKGRLKYRFVFDYIYQIGLALKYVHDKDLVHRDVQPKNIMIEKTKVKKRSVLIDFGIVKYQYLVTNEHPSIQNFTHHKQQDGTFNPKLDVYGLAACLYNALTNELPTDSGERVRRHRRGEKDLIPPRRHNPSISQKVNDVILKGMDLELENVPSIEKWLKLLPKPLHWRWQQLIKANQSIVNWLRNFFR
ncbi:MAG: serine/threonine protein kinase [Stigonema ocellatum SAG 48.90 = DSM 106950]|nr:serine/threonine protein kinase [Stigonema ocellatum SAG 48.90 = DSM 106950]